MATVSNQLKTSEVSSLKTVNNQKNSFENMLMMLIGDNSSQAIPAIGNENIPNLDIMNLISDDNKEENDKTNNNIVSILAALMQNPLEQNIQDLKPESIIYNCVQNVDLQQNPNIQNLLLNEYTTNIEKSAFNKDSLNFKNLLLNGNDVRNEKNMPQTIKFESALEKQPLQITKTEIENINLTKDKGILKLTEFKEAIFSKTNKTKDSFNGEIYFNSEAVNGKVTAFADYNKIIEVSDESAKINQSVLAQVEDKIVMMAKDGTQQVTMELFPENLGKVNIKMSIEAEKMIVEIMSLDGKTGNILALNAPELTKALQNNFSNGTVHVTVTDNSLNQYNQNSLNYNQQQSEKQRSSRDQNFNNNTEDIKEDFTTTEMINLRNLKLNKVV